MFAMAPPAKQNAESYFTKIDSAWRFACFAIFALFCHKLPMAKQFGFAVQSSILFYRLTAKHITLEEPHPNGLTVSW